MGFGVENCTVEKLNAFKVSKCSLTNSFIKRSVKTFPPHFPVEGDSFPVAMASNPHGHSMKSVNL